MEVNLFFCCTNIDLHSLEDYEELERRGFAPQILHCLGLCHDCAMGKMAVLGSTIITRASPGEFLATIIRLMDP